MHGQHLSFDMVSLNFTLLAASDIHLPALLTRTWSQDRRRRLALDSESDCQGDYSEYWDVKTGSWRETYETLGGESHPLDMFFMQEVEDKNELWVTAIEDWMAPSLYNQLQNTYVRLNLTCPAFSKPQSCLLFQPT